MQLSKIQGRIFDVRGAQVMLDFDLVALYEVETRVLKQAVRRNRQRFPEDFMFELTRKVWKNLIAMGYNPDLRSQSVISSSGRGDDWGGMRHLPFAFTEQGVAMLSGVLKSKKAVQVNIAIMRAFVALRQFALGYKELTRKIHELEARYNKNFKDVFEALDLLLAEKIQQEALQKRKRIGYKTDEI